MSELQSIILELDQHVEVQSINLELDQPVELQSIMIDLVDPISLKFVNFELAKSIELKSIEIEADIEPPGPSPITQWCDIVDNSAGDNAVVIDDGSQQCLFWTDVWNN